MPTSQAIVTTPAGKDMTLAELREFLDRCVAAEIPLDTCPIVRTSVGGSPRIRRIESEPPR